ncbi:MAG: hypothetical protein AAFU85_28005 [Planctomycetota bacterium]
MADPLEVVELKLADLFSGIVSVAKAEDFFISVPGDRLGKVDVEFGNGRVVQLDGSDSAIERFRSEVGQMSPEPFRFESEASDRPR